MKVYMFVLAATRIPISVLESRSSASNAAGHSPESKHPSHSVTFHYRWVIRIKSTVESVK